MSIGTNHPEYEKMLPSWTKIRDVLAGEEAVKAKGEEYLPSLPGQKQADYDFYLDIAYFFEGSSRAAEAFVGMLTRSDPAVEIPPAAEAWRDDIAGSGTSLDELFVATVCDVTATGRCGILVDWPGSTEGMTRAEAERSGSAPRVLVYPAESIVNWQDDDRGRLAWVVVEERVRKPDADRYSHATVRQRRELFIDEEDGTYRQRVFQLADEQQTAAEENWVQVAEVTPQKSGQPWTAIPWVWLGSAENGSSPNMPPLRQIVNAALALYRNAAAYEKALVYGGNPQPWVALGGWNGRVDKDEPARQYTIGGADVWELPEGSEAGVLDFASGGEMPLERAIEAKKRDMAVLGARLLEGQKKGAEAAETEEIRRSGENSAIGRIADNLTLAWSRTLALVAEWAGWSGEVGVTFSKDFLTRPLSAQEVLAGMDLVIRGAWHMSDLHSFLIAGEWQPETRTTEAIEADLEAARPSAAPARPLVGLPGGAV